VRFSVLASHPHWIDHLAPVYKALDPSEKIAFYTHPRFLTHARARGIRAVPFPSFRRPERDEVTLIASETDRARIAPFRVVRFEHGAGGSFHGGPVEPMPGMPRLANKAAHHNPSYAGGDRQRNVIAFLNPNAYAQYWWELAYPKIPSYIIGTPKLDAAHAASLAEPKVRSDPPVVAISFHFDATIMPESRSTFPHYADAVAELVRRSDIEFLGHSHPKFQHTLEPFWREHGVAFEPDFAQVLARADCYVIDSLSTLYEFASIDRPVVVLNAPWFRRDVEHGLRFWEHSELGPSVWDPEDLSDAVEESLADPAPFPERRRLASEAVYPYRGVATERAVEVLRCLKDVGGRRSVPGSALVDTPDPAGRISL
jgi:hypothetical protein